MLTIIGNLFVILGFILWYRYRTIYKKDESLRIGIIKSITEDEDGTLQTEIQFNRNPGTEDPQLETDLVTGKYGQIGKEIMIRLEDDGSVSVSGPRSRILYAAVLCWIVSLILFFV